MSLTLFETARSRRRLAAEKKRAKQDIRKPGPERIVASRPVFTSVRSRPLPAV